jgi:hypothetical protein
MKDELISFETAKLAKEKEFDWRVRWRYQGEDDDVVGGALYNHNNKEEQELWSTPLYSAPTQSLLQKWLREECEILVSIYYQHWRWCWRVNYENVEYWSSEDSYEEALEEGLKNGLKII